MQTTLTLDQMRDLFFYEDELDITIYENTSTGTITVPIRGMPAPVTYGTIEEAFAFIRGYYMAARDSNTLPRKESV